MSIGYSYERLDGSVRGEERYLAIQNFNETEDTFIFLLSTKAGKATNIEICALWLTEELRHLPAVGIPIGIKHRKDVAKITYLLLKF